MKTSVYERDLTAQARRDAVSCDTEGALIQEKRGDPDPHLLWLYEVDGIGRVTIEKLLEVFGSAKQVCQASPKERQAYLTPAQSAAFARAQKERTPEQALFRLQSLGARFITRLDADYPSRLRGIPDAPFALYVLGELPPDDRPSVAIVGARMCSDYGRYMARRFGTALAHAGISIVSGMALGVDGISQKGALDAGGRSFGVLGSGVDVCYPPEHRDLYERLKGQGGILSEYHPGEQPRAALFPPRNRIISGLADVVLVIEARRKSGTLITVDMALEQGRDVFALPGRVTDRLSDGCNALLRQGAMIATDPANLFEYFFGIRDNSRPVFAPQGNTDSAPQGSAASASHGSTASAPQGSTASAPAGGRPVFAPALSPLERQILSLLDIDAVSAAEIQDRLYAGGTVAEISVILDILVRLSLQGLAHQDGVRFAGAQP